MSGDFWKAQLSFRAGGAHEFWEFKLWVEPGIKPLQVTLTGDTGKVNFTSLAADMERVANKILSSSGGDAKSAWSPASLVANGPGAFHEWAAFDKPAFEANLTRLFGGDTRRRSSVEWFAHYSFYDINFVLRPPLKGRGSLTATSPDFRKKLVNYDLSTNGVYRFLLKMRTAIEAGKTL
jgi:hypothetical protein